ncbi:MAG TPA: hypothetical protein VKZ98_00040, partial [Aquaticitalea sp.]|nr:hypothetical protein [Aquaticitalea sp.]
MTKITKNGANVPQVVKLKGNPKQLLNQDAQEHEFLNGEKDSPPTNQQVVDTEDEASKAGNQHIIQVDEAADEAEKKRKHVYASITNTITNCGVFIATGTKMGNNYETNLELYQLVSLKAMETEAKTLVKQVDNAEGKWKYAVAHRRDEF